MVIEFSISNNAGLEAIPNYNGADPNYLTYNPGMRYIGSIAAESARFIKEAITLRREGRKYFFGQWQPTPNLDVQEDVHVFWNFGRTEKFTMSVPRIISSAWEANDGTLGFFFANHYRNEPSQTATLHIDFSRYGLESGTNYGLFRMGSNESLGRFSNDFTYTFTMPSKTMTGFYVTEVSTGGVGDNGGPGGPGGPGGTGFVPRPQCSDSRDNDSDGAIDYPADRGCSSSSDNSELDSVELNRTNYTIGDEINETIKEKTVEIKVVFWSITSIIVLAIMVIAFIAVKMIRKGRREQQLFSELQTSTNNI